ncbi:MAG: hypothetical protein QOI41_2259 [Myxococcales bacterium]|nr:hypothetical protein [Myxococcales bacterium]
MIRRVAGSVFALVLTTSGCGPKPSAAPPAPPPVPLHLDSACDLAPSAAVEWVVDARPRAVAETPDLIPVIALVVPEARFATFAAAHGGIDLRQITDLCVAKYKDSLLTVARAPVDPARLERTFADRMTHPGGRSVDVVNPPVVRVWGEVNGEAQQLVVFARELVALEQGKAGPVRATEAFALGKLRRAQPVLRGGPLARAVALVGDAPVRAFAPGPFEGETAQGLGGLMRASTAVAASARFADAPAKLAIRIVLTGAWGKDAPAAAERLAAAVHVVSESAFGRLLGLDHPVVSPQVRGMADALVVDVTIDGASLARGMHDALDAEIGDIMRAGGARSSSPDAGGDAGGDAGKP